MKSQFVLVGALCLASLLACPSYAGVTINGTTITFSDASVQSTAYTGDGGGAPADHGGTGNTVNGTESFIGGGYNNLVTDDYGTIGGGEDNQAGNDAGTMSDRPFATVGGGRYNVARGAGSTIGGGAFNTAGGVASTVGGGILNTADGDYSFVAGMWAFDIGYDHSFVWAGAYGVGGSPGEPRTSLGFDTFNVWSFGGIYLNGAVHASSDRNMKEAFSFISAREVLDKVVEMPVTTWRFKTEDDSVRHIGPMAQDFMAAFGYGSSDKHIVGTDADGVALAAIQGLHQILQEKEVTIQEQNHRIDALEAQTENITALRWQNAFLQARLARLEKAILREHD